MKTIKTTIAILALSIFTISCSKDNAPSPAIATELKIYDKENPLPEFLTKANLNNLVPSSPTDGKQEIGLTFKPLVKGSITAIEIKIPFEVSNLIVSIWDFETQQIIRTETINNMNSGTRKIAFITPLTLIKDKRYVISMNTNSYYTYRNVAANVDDYPIIIGNIAVLNTNYSPDTVTNPTYPSTIFIGKYSGNCSFLFQQTD